MKTFLIPLLKRRAETRPCLEALRNVTAGLLAVLSVQAIGTTSAQAFTYELCIGVPSNSKHGGTDSEGLNTALIGSVTKNGAIQNSEWVAVTQPGNDLDAGTESCFEFDSATTEIGDLGTINRVRLAFGGGDDFCINKVTVAIKNGSSSALSVYDSAPSNSAGACMGNNAGSATHTDWINRNPLTPAEFDDGRWKLICQNRCGIKEIERADEKSTEENNLTKSEMTEVAKSFEFEYEATSYTAKGSVEETSRSEMIQETKSKIERGLSHTFERDLSLTFNEMKENKINAMWVWTIAADLGRTKMNIRSNRIVCTRGVAPPDYGPYDEKGARTCLGRLAEKD